MTADLATDHRLGIWDAVIFSSAAEGGCRLLLSVRASTLVAQRLDLTRNALAGDPVTLADRSCTTSRRMAG